MNARSSWIQITGISQVPNHRHHPFTECIRRKFSCFISNSGDLVQRVHANKMSLITYRANDVVQSGELRQY